MSADRELLELAAKAAGFNPINVMMAAAVRIWRFNMRIFHGIH